MKNLPIVAIAAAVALTCALMLLADRTPETFDDYCKHTLAGLNPRCQH